MYSLKYCCSQSSRYRRLSLRVWTLAPPGGALFKVEGTVKALQGASFLPPLEATPALALALNGASLFSLKLHVIRAAAHAGGLHEVLMPGALVPGQPSHWFLISMQVHVLGTAMKLCPSPSLCFFLSPSLLPLSQSTHLLNEHPVAGAGIQ